MYLIGVGIFQIVRRKKNLMTQNANVLIYFRHKARNLTNIYMFILHILWARKQLDFKKQYKTQLKKETFTL